VLNRENILEEAKNEGVKFLRLQFTNIFGALKNIAMTSDDLEKAMEGQVAFYGSVVDGVAGNKEQDIILRPDLPTFMVLPWRPREGAVARLICDAVRPDGAPYPGCSRGVLKQVQDETARMGLEILVGTEVEFYLFHTDNDGNSTTNTHDYAGLCDLTPADMGESARRHMVLSLEEMGTGVEFSHHETGPGQHSIILKPDNILAIADKLISFKYMVRTIAQRHGLHASFMPKPLNGCPGSALRLNLFVHHKEYGSFSDEAQTSQVGHFIGGILAHTRANAAITNPLINSYKRLVPSDPMMPVHITWSEDSRNSVLRVVPHPGVGTRVVVRNPDSACNPYLALSVILKAGMDGIRQQTPLPPQLAENNTLNDTRHPMVDRLPRNLEEALQELASSQLARSTLGEYIYRIFARAKSEEWERFQAFVHPWELNEYLPVF
jgi:glutamine synthetase